MGVFGSGISYGLLSSPCNSAQQFCDLVHLSDGKNMAGMAYYMAAFKQSLILQFVVFSLDFLHDYTASVEFQYKQFDLMNSDYQLAGEESRVEVVLWGCV